MKPHFQQMASYTAWANARLYADAAALPDGAVDRDIGLYFKSVMATLAHVLQSDRAWTFLLQGGALSAMALPPAPPGFADIREARRAQDEMFADWIDGLEEGWFDEPFSFVSGLGSLKGMAWNGTNGSTLTHVLNHQTHHRGQAHAGLTILGVAEPQGLDIVIKGFLGH